jgi:uncharacterized protein YlaN (UPF0358 family)
VEFTGETGELDSGTLMESVDLLTVCVVELEVEAAEDEVAVLLIVQTDVDGFEEVLVEVHGLLDDQVYGVLVDAEEVLHLELVDSEEVLDHQVYGVLVEAEEVLLDVQGLLDHQVYGVLVETEEVVHLELVEADEVLHLELVDFEDVVHFELVEDVLEEVHGVEVVFVEEQGVEVDFEEVQGVEVVLEDEHRVEEIFDLLHFVEDDDLVHRLLEVLDLQPAEHEVLVKVVAGVQVQVLQLVVTTGLPAVVIL